MAFLSKDKWSFCKHKKDTIASIFSTRSGILYEWQRRKPNPNGSHNSKNLIFFNCGTFEAKMRYVSQEEHKYQDFVDVFMLDLLE